MSDQLVVYVRLLDEGTVSASCDSEGAYRLTGKQDPGERWEFGPGSLVRCAPKILQRRHIRLGRDGPRSSWLVTLRVLGWAWGKVPLVSVGCAA
jgi:hypothetical protein